MQVLWMAREIWALALPRDWGGLLGAKAPTWGKQGGKNGDGRSLGSFS